MFYEIIGSDEIKYLKKQTFFIKLRIIYYTRLQIKRKIFITFQNFRKKISISYKKFIDIKSNLLYISVCITRQ